MTAPYPAALSAQWRGLLHTMASLRLTLVLLLLLLLVAALLLDGSIPSLWLSLPLGLLTLNLLAAILTHPTFRREPALLAFHLALLALVLLIALGRLSYLTGQAEVTTGESFDETAVQRQSGPWHKDRLAQLQFRLDSFSIDYTPLAGAAQRNTTRAHIRWRDRNGQEQQDIVGDHRPLMLAGYRFYTTHNKGFAPFFIWQPGSGALQQGSVHLPAWPANEYKQALEWRIPNTAHQLWTELQFDEVILDPKQPSQFRIPKQHLLVVRVGEQRYALQPGQSIEFDDGRLTYSELRTWMGFAVYSDWTLPWLFAAGVMAVLSLGWHYWRRFAAQPWQAADATDAPAAARNKVMN
jgi:cytochrome c biogenesis protein ResB